MNNCELESPAGRSAVAFHDVDSVVRSWGRRGIFGGGLFGLALGISFVAIPFTSDVLTFGVAGTLIVATVESAVIAGAFGAFAAALYGRSVRHGTGPIAGLEQPPAGRIPKSGWRDGDVPLSDWPSACTYPGSPTPSTVLERRSSILSPWRRSGGASGRL